MTAPHACTIASNNYLAMASVFAESYLKQHPGATVFVCVVDEPAPGISYARLPFRVVFARDLGIPAFRNMAFRYDVMELNTAVKPYFLAYLRDQFGIDRVFYFDPDIVVYQRLDHLERELAGAPMLLTPHITAPLDDNRSPSERLIRQVGTYNLGFLGLRLDDSTRPFLDWWQRRLYRQCLSDPSNGLFVDQSWMDLAPALVAGVRVIRDPIYNLAYWNLAHRFPQQQEGGTWLVDGQPMAFFHFSGFDADDIDAVSRHQNRIRLRDREELRPLFEDYHRRLTDHGFYTNRETAYAYACFEGMPLPTIPRFIRRTLARVDPEGRRWPDPFATETEDSFFAWLEEAQDYALGSLPRGALCLWEERWDLRIAFPDATGEDLPAFARWLRKGGGLEGGLWPSLVGRARADARRSVRAAPRVAERAQRTNDRPKQLDLRRPGQSYAWLNQPVFGLSREAPRLTTAALLLHEMRPDVQSSYPDPRSEDQAAYAHWFVFYGAREAGLDRKLVDPVARTLPIRQRLKYFLLDRLRSRQPGRHGAGPLPPSLSQRFAEVASPASAPGVNLAGYFDMDTGVGQAVRGSAAALAAAGVSVARIELDHTVLGGDPPEHSAGAPYRISLIHANADQTRRAMAELPAGAAAGSLKIGYWFWELAHFPLSFSQSFTYFDEIWAPTRFCADSFRSLASVPVRHVAPCVLPPLPATVDRSAFGLDAERFYFLFSFDVASVPERKNPQAAIEAISRLVKATKRPVGLVLKINRAAVDPRMVERLRDRAKNLPVVLMTERASRERVDSLLAACDACLSLHRSEGLGMLPIESMYLRKPVVATDYGGVTDFLDETTGFPVEYHLRQLERPEGPYPAGAAWAEPSIKDAVAKMLAVIEQPEVAAERAQRALRRVESLYSVAAASRRFATELGRLLGGEVAAAPAFPVPEPTVLAGRDVPTG
jgi:glycosyltransferase involved in cell wall biosynthesis